MKTFVRMTLRLSFCVLALACFLFSGVHFENSQMVASAYFAAVGSWLAFISMRWLP